MGLELTTNKEQHLDPKERTLLYLLNVVLNHNLNILDNSVQKSGKTQFVNDLNRFFSISFKEFIQWIGIFSQCSYHLSSPPPVKERKREKLERLKNTNTFYQYHSPFSCMKRIFKVNSLLNCLLCFKNPCIMSNINN